MRGAGGILGATSLSLALHTGVAALVLLTFDARVIEEQQTDITNFHVATLAVPESAASQASPQSESASAQALADQPVAARTVPQSKAQETVENAPSLPQVAPKNDPAMASSIQASDLMETRLEYPQISVFKKENEVAVSFTALTEETQQSHLPAATSAQTSPPDRLKMVSADNPPAIHLLSSLSAGETVSPSPTIGASILDAPLETSSAPTTRPIHGPASSSVLPIERTKAVLAWSGQLKLEITDSTVETAAALRLPDAGAEGLRDTLAARLSEVDCARVQSVYNPETGAVDLRGHVKTDADRAQLLSQVRTELSNALPVNDRLRQLSQPQCTSLIRLTDMPLPQSVDQFTNPLVVGDNLQVRTYSYSNGQQMTFDLAGADYDGWLYLDYYDSDGQVLHLLPNEFVDPLKLPAQASLVFGDGSEKDPAKGKFAMRVSPPFGEDIAVAMVSSRPIFEKLRPTIEPAEAYLDVLEKRIAELRKDNDFKGEWVYLFIETTP